MAYDVLMAPPDYDCFLIYTGDPVVIDMIVLFFYGLIIPLLT